MGEFQGSALRSARDNVELAMVLRHLMPSDTLNLDAAGLANRQLRPSGDAWILAGGGADLCLGGAAGARMRIVRHGITYLLAGANGHASVLAAIKAARGGETILVAPGTYREAQHLVIDRPVTLQGVSRQGVPIVDAADVAATIIAPRAGAGEASFAILAPGVVIQGLSFLAADRQQADIPRADAGALSLVRLFDRVGKLQRMYPDIQKALDAAAAGDRIQVPAGRHVGDLHIRASVTLAGMNMGRPGTSPRRETETTILGRIVMGRGARTVVIDGLVVWGSFVMEPAVVAERRFELRNCVLDGRDDDTAIAVARGVSSEIVNNLIRGGNAAAIRIGRGFDGLSICGNRIEAAAGAVGIAISGGPGPDRVEILGNTLLDGDYGVFFHVDSCLGQRDDTFVLSGNHFGEGSGGIAGSAPVVAAVHADDAMPTALRASVDASLALNNYHGVSPDAGVDVVFEA